MQMTFARACLCAALVIGVLAGPAAADEPPPPRPGFTTGPMPGFTTGRMPGFTSGPISDPRAGFPVCSLERPCVIIIDEDDPRQPAEEQDPVGTLEGDP